jgi:hypothetical protein
MDGGKIATGLAFFISMAAIFTCLGFVARMHSDITDLYNECMADIEEFNVRLKKCIFEDLTFCRS